MKTEFKVSGMHCKSCIAVISMNIEELPGITAVFGDPEKGVVQVTFDEKKATHSEIVKKIEESGSYKVLLAESKKG